MPIWYVGCLVPNNYRPVLPWLRQAVQSLVFGQKVPLARFSPSVRVQLARSAPLRGRNRGAQQRYMFLGVDAQDRKEAENVLDSVCRLASRIARSTGGDLQFGDRMLPSKPNSIPYLVEPRVWHFTRGDYTEGDVRSTWRVPASRRQQEGHTGDAFDVPEPDSTTPQPPEVDPAGFLQAPPALEFKTNGEQQARHQRLLLWLSAAGQGSWDTFVRVSNQLGTSNDSFKARRLMRRLILLGHVETKPDGSAWSASPAALVQLALDPTRAFWCGQRSEPMQHKLGEIWPITTSDPQPGNDAPPRSLVTVGKVRDPAVHLKSRGLCIRWEGTAAGNLVRRLPDLDQWRASLLCVERLPTPERAQRWDRGAYHNEPSLRVFEGRPQGPRGLYRLFYGEGTSSFELTGFLDSEFGAFRRGDWYGLRFLAARQTEQSCPARWLTRQGRCVLLVPRSRRWPLLYERALVLASGFLPLQDGDRVCYLDVPFDLAFTLAKLLGVTLLGENDHA